MSTYYQSAGYEWNKVYHANTQYDKKQTQYWFTILWVQKKSNYGTKTCFLQSPYNITVSNYPATLTTNRQRTTAIITQGGDLYGLSAYPYPSCKNAGVSCTRDDIPLVCRSFWCPGSKNSDGSTK